MSPRTGKFLADALYWVHLALAVLGLASLPALLIWPALDRIIIAGLVVTLGSWVLLGGCALSDWERRLRRMYDPANVDPRPFVQRYFERFLHLQVGNRFTKLFGYFYAVLLLVALLFR